MKKIFIVSACSAFFSCASILPFFFPVFAAPPSAFTGTGSPYEKCGTTGIDGPQKDSLICVTQTVLDMAVKGVGAIVVVMIVISGLIYMTSAGNPAQAEKGKKTLVGSIIGLIIIVMSYTVVKLLTVLLG